MLFGFVIPTENGGSNFGVVEADCEMDARDTVCECFDLKRPDVEICDPAFLLANQYGGVALFTPAEN